MVDLIIIGAGPGGYEMAIRARQNGLTVQLFEERDVGGTCLNRGCIPTKALLHAGEFLDEARHSAVWGIQTQVRVDEYALYQKKDEVVSVLRQGIRQLLEANGVELILQKATIVDGEVVAGGKKYPAHHVVIATGSVPSVPPVPGLVKSGRIFTSDEALQSPLDFEHVGILGGGVIGVELAGYFLSVGKQVSVFEGQKALLPFMDKEISQSVQMALKKKGASIQTKCMLAKVEENEQGVILHFEGEQTARVDCLLVATGRSANIKTLFQNECPLALERGRIKVTSLGETSLPHMYAIGDATDGIQLAHYASWQGVRLADHLAGKPVTQGIACVPSCIYLVPEIACVGLTEAEAEEQGCAVMVSKYSTLSNGRTLIQGSGRGFIKVVAEQGTEKILGAQLMCDRASDLIDLFTQAIAGGQTVQDMLKGMRPHPTFVEGVQEALEGFHGRAIHALPKKR